MFADGTICDESSTCGCAKCEPAYGCEDCGIGLLSGNLCVDCAGERAKDAAGIECAALCLDFMQASNRLRAVDDAGPAADLGLAATEAA